MFYTTKCVSVHEYIPNESHVLQKTHTTDCDRTCGNAAFCDFSEVIVLRIATLTQ